MSSSVTKKHEWSRWILYGSDWATSYSGNASIKVTRADGADTAALTLTGNFQTYGGDVSDWYLWFRYKKGESGTWSSWTHVTLEGHNHQQGVWYTGTLTGTQAVGTSAGKIYTQVQLTIENYASYDGGASSVWEESFDYSSKGASEIASATKVTIYYGAVSSGTITLTNYLDSTQIGSYEFSVYQDAYSSTNPIFTKTVTGLQSSFTWELTNSSTVRALLEACYNQEYPILKYSLATYDPNGKLIGRTWFEGKSQVSADLLMSCGVNTITSRTRYVGSNIITSGSIRANVNFTGYTTSRSKIASYYYTITNSAANFSYTSDTVTLNPPSSSTDTFYINPDVALPAGTTIFTMYTKDTRSRTGSDSLTFTVYDYTMPKPKIAVNCSGTTATITASWVTSDVNSANDPKLKITMTRKSDSTSTTLLSWTSVNDTSLTSPGYTGSHTIAQTITDLESETYDFVIEMKDDAVGVYSTNPTAKATSGFICMSALRGGNGVRFFGEAQASDAGTLTVYGRSGASGFRYYDAKDNNKFVDLWLSDTNSTSTVQRGLYDASYDTVSSTGAGWWCYLSDAGNININNNANASTRGIYLNSHNIYGRVGSTDYKLDWHYTTTTVNGWTCRKHVNGIWECTKDISVTGTINTSWGSVYYLELGSLTWPATITSTSQVLSCNITRIGSVNGWVWVGEAEPLSTAHTQVWELYRPVAESSSKTYTFRVHAIIDYSGNEEEE